VGGLCFAEFDVGAAKGGAKSKFEGTGLGQ
jgi:hypothetical protein